MDSKIFNDQDRLLDLLESLKTMSRILSTFHAEASDEMTVEEIEDLQLSVQDAQRDTFLFLQQRGWYPLEKENDATISKVLTKYEMSRIELPEF